MPIRPQGHEARDEGSATPVATSESAYQKGECDELTKTRLDGPWTTGSVHGAALPGSTSYYFANANRGQLLTGMAERQT